MEDFENLSDEDLQQLMQLGVAPDQLDSLKQQIESAQKLRNKPMPQGYDTGRVYVAASPLEHLASTLQGIKSGKEIDAARAQQQKILADQVRGRKTFFNRMNEISPVETTVGPMHGAPPGGY